MPDPWRSRKKCSPPRRRFLVEPRQAAANRFSRITKHESRNTAFSRPGLRSMKIMVREMSLIRGLGAPAKEMSFRHLLALFKDLSCPLLPTIARHCPRLPAKKMLQALVASQYGRGSRGPGRVPRAAPRQPGCTAEPTNHEPRSFLARGASRREFRGFHESRVTAFFRRGCARVAPPETAVRTTAPPASRCFPGFTKKILPRTSVLADISSWSEPSPRPWLSRNTAFFRITAFLPSRQARRLQGGMYEAVRKRVERGLSESRDKNNDFFRIPTRFTTRYIPLFPTMRRKDSDKPLPPIKRLRALRQPEPEPRLHGCIKSPRNLPWPAGLAKWRGEGRRCHESRNTAFDLARGARRPEFRGFHETRDTRHGFFSPWVRKGRASGNPRPDRRPVTACLRAVGRHGAAMARHGRHIAPAPASLPRPPFAGKSHKSGQNPGSARENMKHSVHRGSRLPSGAFARHGAAIARHARGGSGG